MTLSARLLAISIALALCWAGPVLAADPTSREEQLANSIPWQQGPCTGILGDQAEISVPAGFAFTGKDGAKKLMELTQNPSSGRELGVIIPQSGNENDSWFLLFQYRPEGYIKDDERDKLDGDKILTSIRQGTEAGNEERKKRGWSAVEVVGWDRAPFYDQKTNNLTWAIRGRSDGGESVNYSTRMLGRGGYMMADLVISPNQLATTLPAFETLIGGFRYTPGHRYAEYRQGDKLASYGLTALVAGGAGAVAAKTGLLAKFWKAIVALFIAAAAMVKRMWAKLSGEQRVGS